MASYILKRLLLIIPTLLGIMLINFVIVQSAPGGPIEQIISKVRGQAGDAESRLGGSSDMGKQFDQMAGNDSIYRGAQGIDPEFIKELEIQFGFDKPAHERFFKMIKDYSRLDFGKSYFRDTPVITLIQQKLPVSISLGLWTTLLIYLISIPLGIRKAVRDGSRFDMWTSAVIVIGYAIPSFLFALFLILFFAGGSYFTWFPLKGLISEGWAEFGWFHKITDYLWHMVLPITAMVIGGFAKLTLLTKNSFIEEINKHYVLTARAKGVSEKSVLYGHVFRNAMLIVIAGFPAAFIHIFFTSSLLIEFLFSLDGLGYMGFEAALSRDYPLMFGTLFIYTLIGMVLQLIGDLTYMLVDRRIDLTASRG
ncbi:microcin C ABC transporter permease YejB [Candidatus Odyssella acanthamoebae]|uniref:Microcin ABC transporter permease n=1 Tax=Candidatus Odyssella acanthamoebae TaxID=91604 RepID=A0A077AXS0_9PROT|nr:microcin C ABC transporter permease YejB [Candidatus Paracaedibacter acanthamoebae]AIK95515.1 microcin ABC transporter permease [Candidatus Paracaedibacter acanthamoebae]